MSDRIIKKDRAFNMRVSRAQLALLDRVRLAEAAVEQRNLTRTDLIELWLTRRARDLAITDHSSAPSSP